MKVFYVGNDLSYWSKIRGIFEKKYVEFSFEFITKSIDQEDKAKDTFVEIYKEKPEIVYLDFSEFPEKMFYLSKLLNINNETRLTSVVALFEYRKGFDQIKRSISVANRLNHFKTSEMHDVVYDPVSLLNVNFAHKPEYVRSKSVDQFTINQLVKIGYIDSNFFHVETNSYLQVGDILEVDSHPLERIMPSRKVYVESFEESDLYYNRRFAYNLEFIYIDNDFFSATNENWKLYLELKENENGLEHLEPYEKEQILKDMDERRKQFRPTLEKIEKWLDKKRKTFKVIPKKLKIMIVDSSMEFFNELPDKIESFPYSVNIQTCLINDQYQVKRTMPHLLVYRMDDNKNDEKMLKAVINKIKEVKNYEPYVLVFNCESNKLDVQAVMNYKNLLTYSGKIHISDVEKIAKTLDKKLQISDPESKVFFRSSDPESVMLLSRKVDVLAMTESVLYFESKIKIPMWTVFMVKDPIPMVLTVVPHKDDGPFKTEKDVYRCLINGVGEIEKTELRQLINKSFMVEAEEENRK